MTAPGERLTPQQMRAKWEKIPAAFIRKRYPSVAALFEDVLAAWQADREALEMLRRSHEYADRNVDRLHGDVNTLRALLRRAREALRPIAHAAEFGFASTAAVTEKYGLFAASPEQIDHDMAVPWLLVGDLREAKRMLAELDAAQGET